MTRTGARSIVFPVLLFLLAAPWCCSGVLAAEQAKVEELAVIDTEQQLLFYCRLQDAMTPEMEEALMNGIPLTFSFAIELLEAAKEGEAAKVAERSFEHSMRYDSLKEQFRIELTEHGGRVVMLQGLDEAREAMNRVIDLPLAQLALLRPGFSYMVKARAWLAKKNLPLNFQQILPFGPLWKFETEWNSLLFTYGNPGPETP